MSSSRIPFSPLAAGLWGILTLPLFFSAGMDLWVQTLIHGLFYLLALYSLWIKNRSLFSIDAQTVAWTAFLAVNLIVARSSGSPSRSQQELFLWADYFLAYVLARQLSVEEQKLLLRGLWLSWSVLIGWGLFEWVTRPDLPKAGLVNPNALGSYLLFPICLGISRKATWAIVFAAGVMLLGTRSVAAILGLAAAFVYWTWDKTALRPRLRFAVLAAALLIAIPFAVQVVRLWDWHRWYWWKTAWAMFQSHPWTGLGPGTFELGFFRHPKLDLFTTFAHNTYLQWAVENGIFCIAILAVLLVYCFKRQPDRAIRAAGLGLLFHNAVDFSLLLPSHALAFWALLALSSRPAPPVKSVLSLRGKDATFPGLGSRKSTAEKVSPDLRPGHIRTVKPATPATRVAITLILVALAWTAGRDFMANRLFAQGGYRLSQSDSRTARDAAQRALSLDPTAADPLTLLARTYSDDFQSQPGRGPLLACLGYTLAGLQREPVQALLWEKTIRLYEALGLPGQHENVKQRLFERYPYMRHDKRFNPPS